MSDDHAKQREDCESVYSAAHPVSRETLSEHLVRAAIRANTGHVDVLIDNFVSSLLDKYSITHKRPCGEPWWPEPGHQHRCSVVATHEQGSAPGDDFVTDMHKCDCGFTWVVN